MSDVICPDCAPPREQWARRLAWLAVLLVGATLSLYLVWHGSEMDEEAHMPRVVGTP